MNKITRKLFISVLTLAFALVTLGATTFAWFTLTATVTVEKMDFEIVAGEGIQLSVDGTNYRRVISNDELLDFLGLDDFPILKPVTTENGSDFTVWAEKSTGGEMESTPAPTNTDYIEFQLWFRSPKSGTRVYLDGGTNIIGQEFQWRADTTFNVEGGSVAANSTIWLNAANSLRFSFQEFASFDDDTSKFESPVSNGLHVFEFDHENAGNSIVNQRLENEVKLTGLVDYWWKKLPMNIFLGTSASAPIADEADDINLPSTFYTKANGTGMNGANPNVTLATLVKAGAAGDLDSYGFTTVRVWLEGWDPDNIDAVMGKSISVFFSFTAASPVTP